MSDTSMTAAEQALADDRMRAEIAKLIAETARINSAEIAKLIVETRQISLNMLLAPFLAAAGVMGATAAIVKLFFGP